jgi:cold shock CspA family protein
MRIAPYTFGRALPVARRSVGRPPERRGLPDNGHIVKLYIGQGYGFIRPADEREIYFHRGDLEEGTSINDCHIGDLVSFERVDDLVSGPRARCVRRRASSRD